VRPGAKVTIESLWEVVREIDWYQNEWPWPAFRGRIKVTSTSTTALHSTLNIITVRDVETILWRGAWQRLAVWHQGEMWTLQQDGAHSHTARNTVHYLQFYRFTVIVNSLAGATIFSQFDSNIMPRCSELIKRLWWFVSNLVPIWSMFPKLHAGHKSKWTRFLPTPWLDLAMRHCMNGRGHKRGKLGHEAVSMGSTVSRTTFQNAPPPLFHTEFAHSRWLMMYSLSL